MTHLSTLQITLQHPRDDVWPVSAVLKSPQPEITPRWQQSQLAFPAGDWENELLRLSNNPEPYGLLLGKALFHSGLDQLLHEAIASYEHTRLFLVIEAPQLQTLRWERLYFPDASGEWLSLAQNQRILLSYYTATLATRYYPSLLQRDLKVLFLICSPPEGDSRVTPFDTKALEASLRQALGNIEAKILYRAEETTLKNLCACLNEAHYPVLHIISHGYYDKDRQQNYLMLLDEKQQIRAISTGEFIRNLLAISPLPQLIFFSSCETAAPQALNNVHGHFALQVRNQLSTPAVIAMSDTVSQDTANTISREFYPHLYQQAYVDVALAKAGLKLLERRDRDRDRYMPVLFQRLGNTPLFGFEPKRLHELDNKEIGDGLVRLEKLLPQHAPAALADFKALAVRVRAHEDNALEEADQFCHEVTEISFAALAQDDSGEQIPAYNAECPFPGMRPFKQDVDDGIDYRKYFFGRQQETSEVIERLKQENIIAIVGPSGSGKSSLVFAGILPQLQKQNPNLQIPGNGEPGMRPICRMEQGERTTPLQTLRQLLASVEPAKPTLVFIDQFEEIFTTCGTTERQQFLQELIGLPEKNPHIKILFTIRADYALEDAYREALLKPIIDRKYYLDLMKADALRAAMEQQAESTGLKFEEGLAHRIISEVVMDEHGVMPLLQHLLWLLWKQRRGRYLFTSAYEQIGGVSQAIASTADALLDKYTPSADSPNPAEDGLARFYLQNIFLRLTRPDTQSQREVGREYRDTRQRVPKRSLYPKEADAKLIDQLIKELADARLIVTYATEIEISHESLITHWGTLKNWLENRQLIEMQQVLSEDAQNWNQARQEGKKYLNDLLRHSGSRIDAIEQQQHNRSMFLNAVEEDYLQACRKRDQRVERNRKNVKRFAVVMVLLFIAAMVVSILAVQQKDKSDDRLAEQYLRKAIDLRDGSYHAGDKAAKYLAKGLDKVVDEELRNSLKFASADLQRFTPSLKMLLKIPGSVNGARIFADHTRLLTWSNDKTARVWNVESGIQIGKSMQHGASVKGAILFAHETRVLTWCEDGSLQTWEIKSGNRIGKPMQHVGSVNGAALFNQEKQAISWGEDETVRVWNIETGIQIGKTMQHDDPVKGVILLPKNAEAVSWSEDGAVRVWNITSGVQMGQSMQNHASVKGAVLFTGGTRLLIWDDNNTMRILDIESGIQVTRSIRNDSYISGAILLAQDTQILSWSEDGLAKIWDIESGTQKSRTFQHQDDELDSQIWGAMLFADNERLLTWSGDDGTARIWNIKDGGQIGYPMRHGDNILGAGLLGVTLYAEDTRLLTWNAYGLVCIWDIELENTTERTVNERGKIRETALPGGHHKIITLEQNTMRVLDSESGTQIGKSIPYDDSIKGALLFTNDTRIFTWSSEGTAKIWDIKSGKQIGQSMQHDGPITGATLFANETLAMTWSWGDETVRIWKTKNTQQLGVSMHHPGGIDEAIPFADNSRILTWSEVGRTLRVWDTKSGQPIGQPMRHDADIKGAILFATARQVLSWDENQTVQVWDTKYGLPIGQPFHLDSPIDKASLSADNSQVFFWDQQGRSNIWKPPFVDYRKSFLYEIKQTIQSNSYLDAAGDWIFLTAEQKEQCKRVHDDFFDGCEESNDLHCKFNYQIKWPAQKFLGQLPTIEDCLK